MIKIKDYPNYSITREGEVYSHKSNKILKGRANPKGYLIVALYQDKKRKDFTIHRLVLSSYSTPLHQSYHINHVDGNKKNNNLGNLEWCTPAENIRHAFAMGLMSAKGSGNSNSKLTEKDIRAIRNSTGPLRIEAEKYGVKVSCISSIRTGRSWEHV